MTSPLIKYDSDNQDRWDTAINSARPECGINTPFSSFGWNNIKPFNYLGLGSRPPRMQGRATTVFDRITDGLKVLKYMFLEWNRSQVKILKRTAIFAVLHAAKSVRLEKKTRFKTGGQITRRSETPERKENSKETWRCLGKNTVRKSGFSIQPRSIMMKHRYVILG